MLNKIKNRRLSTALQLVGFVFMAAGAALVSVGSFGHGEKAMEDYYEENFYNLDIDEVNEYLRNKEEITNE